MAIDVDSNIRDVTDDEVEFYRQNGWVKLDRLLNPDFAHELRRLGERIRDTALEASPIGNGDPAHAKWKTSEWLYSRMAAQDGSELSYIADIGRGPFPQLVLSKRLAADAHKLIDRISLTDRSIGVRVGVGGLIFKTGPGGPVTGYHQDQTVGRFDGIGSVMFWVALDDLTPDQGTMRFVSGSHRIGQLPARPEGKDLLELYPKLVDKLSGPMSYAPGDATAHDALTVHGGPENTTHRTRWAFYQAYASEDCHEITADRVVASRATDPSLPYDERWPVVYRPV